ncbi:MAG: BON domain-containing protein [Acidobacteriaceae bacterium]|nr:BON domain-containing protein [Acidobacteriaceae bacterium]
MNRIRALLLTTGLLACLLASCAKQTASDQTLTTDIQAKLYADATTKPANVTVAVQDGAVTLSGDVPSSDVELEAMKIANGTPGVKTVNDQMKVNAAMAANQAPNAGTAAPQTPGSYPPISSAPATSAAATPAPPPAPPPPATAAPPLTGEPANAPPPVPALITIPAGERINVRTIDSIDSKHDATGQVFRGTLYAPIVVHGRVVVHAGTPVSVLLAQARGAGRIQGRSELEVRLAAIDYHGRRYPVDSSVYVEEGKARGKETAVHTGIGAAAGAIIGAIAGGGKGAAIGSAAGGGAGFGTTLFTHGQQVRIPSESVLTFRLEAPLTLPS